MRPSGTERTRCGGLDVARWEPLLAGLLIVQLVIGADGRSREYGLTGGVAAAMPPR